MLNSINLIGRLVETPNLNVYNGSNSVTNLRLAVTRPFKNSQGDYETDFFNVSYWDANAKNVCDYCRKGDLIMVIGRLQPRTSELNVEVGGQVVTKKIANIDVIGERIVFLATSGRKEEYVEEDYNQDQ